MKGVEARLVKTLKTKKVYNVFFEKKDTNFVCQEVFSNGKTKRYPFYIQDGKPVQKYKSIKCLTTTERTRPSSGFSITASRGFGFTNPKGVQNLFYYFQEQYPKVNEIVFLKSGTTEIKGKKLYLTLNDFARLEKLTGVFVEAKKAESKALYQDCFSKVLPTNFSPPDKDKYVPGSLSSYLNKQRDIELSKDDIQDLKQLFVSARLTTETIVSTRNELDIIYYEDVIEEFKKLLKQKTDTKKLEEKWHQFFKRHTWIFSQIFSFPATLLKDKLNVGGHNIEGDTDKIVDYLYKNKITNNIAFIEIKTHLAGLVNATPYRKPDIFSIHSDLSGGIVQVLDQKTKLLRNFHSVIGSSAESLNSICVVIAGQTSYFNKKGQSESFELFRWSNKDVVVIPFDELLNKIEYLLAIFKKDK